MRDALSHIAQSSGSGADDVMVRLFDHSATRQNAPGSTAETQNDEHIVVEEQTSFNLDGDEIKGAALSSSAGEGAKGTEEEYVVEILNDSSVTNGETYMTFAKKMKKENKWIVNSGYLTPMGAGYVTYF